MKSKHQSPLVSIIIPCYNQAHYLPDAINCLLKQRYENWECIIINDGSTDDTVNVSTHYLSTDSRIKLINQKNRGLSGARNRGLDAAQGQFIQFLDADDIIESDKLEIQVELLQDINNEVALCYSDYRHCAEESVEKTVNHTSLPPARFILDLPIHDLAARWETQMSIPVHSFLFNAFFFKDNAIRFDETLPNHEDWDCWMQIFKCDPVVKVTAKALAVYRLSNNSMCADTRLMLQGFRKAIIKQKNIFQDDPIMQQILSEKLVELKQDFINNQDPVLLTHKRYEKGFQFYKDHMPWPLQKVINKISKYLIYISIE